MSSRYRDKMGRDNDYMGSYRPAERRTERDDIIDRRRKEESDSRTRRRSYSPGRDRHNNKYQRDNRRDRSRDRQRSRDASTSRDDRRDKSAERIRDGESHGGRRKPRGQEDEDGDRGRSRVRPEDGNNDHPASDDVGIDGNDDIARMMGFSGFGTTKGKKVVGADVSGVAKNKKSTYRQYMYREGGFNRRLSPPPPE
uniref:ARAD1D25938p n=1 Tax=Blastobotrys adeninivorans TaxID=409370 RepID=A0A060TFU7_BLAAD